MIQLPIQMPNLPTFRESVDRAVAAGNLRTLAARTTDPAVLLGLAFLAPAGDPVRRELEEVAVAAQKDYRPILALLSVMLERIDPETVGNLLRSDPNNAIGHYLRIIPYTL